VAKARGGAAVSAAPAAAFRPGGIRMKRRTPAILVLAALWVCGQFLGAADTAAVKKILYVTTTKGFHHSACEYSIPVIQKMAEQSKKDPLLGAFDVVCTDKTDLITAESLKGFDAICFSNTTGDLAQFPLSEADRNALLEAIKGGKGFIGIHASTDTYKDWQPFADMIGGSFESHPWNEEIIIDIEDPAHPSAACVPSPWKVKDEIYAFKNYSRDKLHVIMSMNKASIKGKSTPSRAQDQDYALAWCKPYGSGRVFYTALGHEHALWDSPAYQQHLMGGIRWALGAMRASKFEANKDGERVGLVKGNALGDANLAVGHKKFESAWEPIFDGKPLAWGTDWEATDNAEVTRKHWTVKDGMLVGDSRGSKEGSSHLYYIKKSFKNFEVRAQISVGTDSNSGFYFRCPKVGPTPDQSNFLNGKTWRNWPYGYEAQINLTHTGDPKRSGTFYAAPIVWSKDIKELIGYDIEASKGKSDDFWYTMRIIAVGDHTVILLNDRVAVDHFGAAKDKPLLTEGLFAFQMHHPGTIVKFKNIEVRELDPSLK
jgi:uncharacterized protein